MSNIKLEIPWIINRRRFFLSVFVDFLLNYVLYITVYFKEFNSFPNSIVTLSISIFWVILSYVLGRYMVCKKVNRIEIFKAIFKSTLVFITCNVIYLSINLSNKIIIIINGEDFVNSQKGGNIFFIKTTLLIAIASCILQYILSIMTNKIYSNTKSWVFYGSESDFANFKKEIGNKFSKYNFQPISDDSDIKTMDLQRLEGVIIDNNKELNKYNFEQIFLLRSKGIKVINVLKWFELKLQRIPPFYIENKYQIIEKFDLLDESYKIRIKRIGDFIVSLFLILTTSPLFILISILIILEDRGPIFYSQVRTGFKGEKIVYIGDSSVINIKDLFIKFNRESNNFRGYVFIIIGIFFKVERILAIKA